MEVISRTGKQRFENFPMDEIEFTGRQTAYWQLVARTQVWRPPTDVFETEEAFIVRVEIAGMDERDISVELDDHLLSVRGMRPDTEEKRSYYQMEIRFGEFQSDVELPAPVIAEKTAAVYTNGFLTVTLPKQPAQPVRIEPEQ